MWQEIEFLPEDYNNSKRMFVVKGVGLPLGSLKNYDTDPYCVWKMSGEDHYARWPFEYPPTHFMEIPVNEDEGYLIFSSSNIFYSKKLLKEACISLELDQETSSWFDVVGTIRINKEKLDSYAALEAENARLKELVLNRQDHTVLLGELYQILGELDASEKVLDQVLAASEGKLLPYETLLVEPEEE